MRAARGPSFRFVYLIWKDPWMTVGPARTSRTCSATWEAVRFHEESREGTPDYPVSTGGRVVAARPDLLILPDEPYRFRERDAAFWRERLPASTRVVLVSGDDFCWHGVRTLRGSTPRASSRGSVAEGSG